MREARERGRLAVALGDFNMTPLSLAHRLVTAHGGVVDAWRVVHPRSATGAAADRPEEFRGAGMGGGGDGGGGMVGAGMPSAAYNLAVNGTTCDSALNTWRWDRRLRGKRLVLRPARDMPPSSLSSAEAQAQAQRLPDERGEEDEEEAEQKVRGGVAGGGVLGRRGQEDAPEAEEQKPKGRPAWRRWWWGWWERGGKQLQRKKRRGQHFGEVDDDDDDDVVVIDPEQLPDPWGKRLDYIFVGQPEQRCCTPERSCGGGNGGGGGGGGGCSGGSGGYYWRVEKVACGMIEPHPTLGCSLSDHFSVEATLCLTPLASNAATIAARHSHADDGGEGDGGSYSPQSPLPPPPPPPLPPPLLPPSTYDEILAMIAAYTAREQRQRRLRLAHFGVQTFVTLGCLVGVWWLPLSWQPSWQEQQEQQQKQQWRRQRVSVAACVFALMLLAVLGFAAGLLDGLIGGLFVSAELRALREFEWEIRNARAQAVAAAVDEAAQGVAAAGGAHDVSGGVTGGDSDAGVGAG